MVLFDDLFYPGNVDKRNEISLLRAQIISQFNEYQDNWNELVDMLNSIFAEQEDEEWQITLSSLTYDIDKDQLDYCVQQINMVVEDTKTKISKLINDIGITDQLPTDWEKNILDYNTTGLLVGKILSATFSATLAGFLMFYVYAGIQTVITLVNIAGAAISSLAGFLAGAFGAAVIGGVAFVITDIISSAITGAIERGELKDAIESLEKLKSDVGDKLEDAAHNIAGVIQSVKDGIYKLDDTHLLVKVGTDPDEFTILEIPSSASARAVKANNVRYFNTLKQVKFA